ncbi:hypothetical protein AAGF08_04810 [Algoriphagus sp. SE2]|uniref:hypothetical protein n=1 Tax=Algoriphagus sp. SE2 TaxID=3141536 RepID=UPI0031CD5132
MREVYFKSFVSPFYKAYLGFFILVFLILGVFMELKQHLMIAEKIMQIQSWFGMLIFSFILYSFLHLRFQIKLLQDPSYWIFQKLSFLPFSKFSKDFISIWFTNHTLILLYSLIISYVGIKNGAWDKVVFLWISILILTLVTLYSTYKTLHRYYPEKRIHQTRIIRIKPYFLWFSFHLKENRPLLLLAVKITSLILLNGFFYSYFSGGYDMRWLAFGLLISSYFHYPIWQEKVEFSEYQLYVFKNLPRTFRTKLFQEFSTMTVLVLPELLLLFYQGRGITSIGNQFSLSFFWVTLQLGIYGLCIFDKKKINLNIPFIAFLLVFLSILFGVELLFLSIIFLIFYTRSIYSPYQN